MRKLWFVALSVTTAISSGACASGTTIDAASVLATIDSGPPSTQNAGGQGEDSGVVNTPGVPAQSDDAGSGNPPSTGEDSGSAPPASDDSGAPAEDSAAPPPVSDDSGAPPVSTANCANTTANQEAWAGVTGVEPVCSSSADCSANECCFVPGTVLSILGPAACIPL